MRSSQFGLGYLRLDRDLQPGMVVTIEPGLYLVPAILDSEELTEPFVADKTLDRERLAAFADVRGIRIEEIGIDRRTATPGVTGDTCTLMAWPPPHTWPARTGDGPNVTRRCVGAKDLRDPEQQWLHGGDTATQERGGYPGATLHW